MLGIALSAATLSFISLAILSDERVRAHPNKLIALVCMCDAYTYNMFFNRYLICGWGLNYGLTRLFSWTVLQPWFWFSVKVLGNEYHTDSGEVVNWDFL